MNEFIVYPALDLKNGNCVRLLKGNFLKQTIYEKDPIRQVELFVNNGFKWIHLIDLDATLSENNNNKNIVVDILKIFSKDINIQFGGGIKSVDDIKFWTEKGIKRVIVGSLAYENPNSINNLSVQYYKKIALALDVRKKKIAINGWKKQLALDPLELVHSLNANFIDSVIYTDIDRDGTLSGNNIKQTLSFSKKVNIPVIASGGVSSIENLISLKENFHNGIKGAIVGKAIYEKKITFQELRNL